VLLLGEQLTGTESPLLGVLSPREPTKLLRLGVIYTFIIEAIGAALLYPMFTQYAPDSAVGVNVYRSIFHAVSAFSNTGLTLQSENLQGLRHYWQIVGVIGPLIVLGSLGVPVLRELLRRFWPGGKTKALSLHSKLVVVTLVVVVVAGSSILMWNEGHSYPGETFGASLSYQDNPHHAATGKALAKLPIAEQVRESTFAVAARTTGFATTNVNALSDGGKMLMALYVFIGGCPAGAGGGVKLGILAILCLNLYHGLRGRTTIRAFGSAISWNIVRVAAAAVLAQVALVLADALLEKLGGDTLPELLVRCSALRGARLGDLPMDGQTHIFWPPE
jgi:trk system potassium uptake protein